jgi:ADP-heptose:LPS heptosyltransferase
VAIPPALRRLHARCERTWTRWTGFLARRDGWLTRRVRWPIPALAPCRRSELFLARRGALGDVLMCTPALRELHRINPTCRVTFFTDYPELVAGLTGFANIKPYSERSRQSLELMYETSIPPQRHIAKIMGDCIGVAVEDVRPDCVADPAKVGHWRNRFANLPRPIVVVNRSAGPYTPNKDWPDAHWCELIESLCRTGSVVEIGAPNSETNGLRHANYGDLRGQTTIPDLVAVIAASDVHVGPISGPVHIAAAFGVPSVVIYGGYEHPICSGYPGNINLFTELPCSPCWLRDGCPYDRKCLRQIRADDVMAAISSIRSRQRLTN